MDKASAQQYKPGFRKQKERSSVLNAAQYHIASQKDNLHNAVHEL